MICESVGADESRSCGETALPPRGDDRASTVRSSSDAYGTI
jgi:hypothetical protein